MDEKERRFEEPTTIDVTTTGTHGAGNYMAPTGEAVEAGKLPPPTAAFTEIWIEQEDQAKQSMARKFNFKQAAAAPDHPHKGHVPGSGESQ